MEEKLAAGAGERQVAEFVEHHEVHTGELGGERAGLADAALLLQPVHRIAPGGPCRTKLGTTPTL